MTETKAKIEYLTRMHLGVKPETQITDATTFEDLGADSLDKVELAMAFEEEFNIEIQDADLGSIANIGEAVKHVDKLRAAA